MSRVSVVVARLRALLARQRHDRELDEEIRFHLEMQMEDNLKAGMDPDEARYAAMRSFGGIQGMRETHRDRRTFTLFETMGQDFRYAARTLRKSPGFTVTAVAVLALAIGANTAVFSVLHAVLLRPLPYQSPEQLAMLWTEDPSQQLREGRSALRDVEQWRRQSQSFEDFATFDTIGTVLTGAEGMEPIATASISPNLLPLLGVRPVLGRVFSSEEAELQQRLVLISHSFWQARFGGSQEALGATLVLNSVPCRIIGILPADFQIARLHADVWEPQITHRGARGPETWFVIGRLRSSVTFDQAQSEMSALARSLNEQMPVAERNRGISVVPLSLSIVGPQSRLALWMLAGTVFCVFLIAAANVTSLSLARSVARTREMAVRAALGASAGRIVRQLLTESLLLAVLSGAAGTLLAYAGIPLIRAFGPANLPRLNEIGLDHRVLGMALAISLVAGVLIGLSPAMVALRRNPRPSGEEGGRSVSGGTTASRIRRALVVADFALAIILLAGAGLLVRSWLYVTSIDPGFRSERVVVMDLASPPGLDLASQRTALYHRVLETVRSVPGVAHAGIIDDLFIENSKQQVVTVKRDEGSVSERLRFGADDVSAGFFAAIGTPLLQGRFFSDADGPDAPLVAIINETMAQRCWRGQSPIGKRFKSGPRNSDQPWYTVVGVVRDMRRQGPEREPFPQMFVPLWQSHASRNVKLFVRTATDDPAAVAGAVRSAVGRVEKNAVISGMVALKKEFETYLAQRRFETSLLAGFSIVALLMAVVGIYGLIQYSIATRTQEIGIRMAVGAHAGDIFRMILGEGLRLSLTGLLLGLVGALWLGQTGASLLAGVTPTDPVTFVLVSFLLMGVAIAACCLPAWRAMKIEPIAALRQE